MEKCLSRAELDEGDEQEQEWEGDQEQEWQEQNEDDSKDKNDKMEWVKLKLDGRDVGGMRVKKSWLDKGGNANESMEGWVRGNKEQDKEAEEGGKDLLLSNRGDAAEEEWSLIEAEGAEEGMKGSSKEDMRVFEVIDGFKVGEELIKGEEQTEDGKKAEREARKENENGRNEENHCTKTDISL